MSDSDIIIFQALAAAFTLSFMVLVFILWRFIHDLGETRARFLDLADGLEDGLKPLLADLRDGVIQARVQGRAAPSEKEALTPLDH